eukprot:COSAG02_NODE_4335_length_5491_cov_14.768361_2_plen_154_part_00
MRRTTESGWFGLLVVMALLLADVGEAKKEKKKRKKFFKEADLLCSACEQMVERVEWNLKEVRKKDEVAITDALDGLCDNMTMYAYSKDYPRKFLRAAGHVMEELDARCVLITLCAALLAVHLTGAACNPLQSSELPGQGAWDERRQRHQSGQG